MKPSTNTSALIILSIIAITCIYAGQSFAEDTAKLEYKAASLAGLTYVKGDPVTFKEGSVYIVEFWATWCPPCRKSIPHLTKLQKQFKEKGVTIIGISNEKDLEKVKKYVAKQGGKMDYTVAVDAEHKISNGYMKAYAKRGIPTAFIVNKKGNVAWVGHPMSKMDEVLAKIVDGTFAPKNYPKPVAKAPAKKPTEPKKPIEPKKTAELGDKAASLAGLTYVKGDPVTFKEGSVYIVEFWATWCPPCLKSIPHLTEVQKQFKEKGVTIIGISDEKDLEKVKNYVTEQAGKMDYTVAVDAERKIINGYMKAYAQRGIPTAFIVDKKGNIAWVGHPMGGMDGILKQVVDGTFNIKAYAKLKAQEDAKKAIEDAKMQKVRKLFNEYIIAVKSGAEIEKTRPIAEKIIESNNTMALNALAMQIVSIKNVDDSRRDYKTALKAVTIANTETKGKDLETLNTYAMVLAKTGKLKEAIETTQKAVVLSEGNKHALDYFNKQLESYKKELEEKNTPTPKETKNAN